MLCLRGKKWKRRRLEYAEIMKNKVAELHKGSRGE
ncbi:hypothetical protein NC652_004810 [Populus alba x Populus x berolinensis]|nr:hypothetical protein NC652_004810 [Populus alba x Populus x berolinensis]